MKAADILKLVLSLALPLAIGAIAGVFTSRAVPEWYASLSRPSFSPPNGIFGPVWTILYIMMGISLFLIWVRPAGNLRNLSLMVFGLQLLLNFGWSFLFFYFRMIGWALAEILLMWVSILAMLVLFYRVRPAAAYLNIPYFLWASFATILNAAYFRLN